MPLVHSFLRPPKESTYLEQFMWILNPLLLMMFELELIESSLIQTNYCLERKTVAISMPKATTLLADNLSIPL